jgi:hypothetical protein
MLDWKPASSPPAAGLGVVLAWAEARAAAPGLPPSPFVTMARHVEGGTWVSHPDDRKFKAGAIKFWAEFNRPGERPLAGLILAAIGRVAAMGPAERERVLMAHPDVARLVELGRVAFSGPAPADEIVQSAAPAADGPDPGA